MCFSLRFSLCMSAAITLAGCSTTSSLTEYVPQIVTPYRIDIQQGNFVTQDMVDKLQAGQTREQVRFILGTPLLADVFHTDRWDYVFRSAKGWNDPEKRRLTVFFDKATRLEKWEAIAVPAPANLAETQALASGGAAVTAVAPSEEEKPGILGRMFGWLTPSPAAPAVAVAAPAAAAADAAALAAAQAAAQAATQQAAAEAAARQAAEQEAAKLAAAQEAAKQAAAEEAARQAAAQAAQQAAARQAAAQQAANQAAVRAAADEAARQAAAQEATRAAALAAEAAAQAAAKQAAASAPAPSAAPSGASTAAITSMVEQWRAAWSAKDPATYLALYAPDFKPANLTRARWEAQRRERLTKSAFIFVNLSEVQIAQAGDNSATVTFTQQYESETLKETGKKILLLANVNGQWLIREETFKVK